MEQEHATDRTTSLGAFSVSLAVKDLAASQAFYEKLDFKVFAGHAPHFLVLKNGPAVIGLFCGMFERNILTFNPGWSGAAQPLEKFVDIRDLQRALEAKGIVPKKIADEGGAGPASFIVVDPDGNEILVDQHV